MMDTMAQLARQFPARRGFITGAGSGLGRALAHRLAAAGWRLGLNDLEPNVHKLAGLVAVATGVGYWKYMPWGYRLKTHFFPTYLPP